MTLVEKRAKHAAWKREYVHRNRKEYYRKQREWRARNPDKVKAWNAKRKPWSAYSPAEKKRALEQKRKYARKKAGALNPTGETNRTGKCPICKRIKLLVYDHDHVTGKHRGWPCNACNWRLGWFEMYKKNIERYLYGRNSTTPPRRGHKKISLRRH